MFLFLNLYTVKFTLLKILLFIYFGSAGSSSPRGLSLVAVSGGYSLVAVCRFLIAVASLVVELRL